MSARPPKIRYSHDAMVDMIVEEPEITQNELAARFGYTPSWVSVVMTSDAWKARLEARKAELVDPILRASLDDRFRALTTRSLEVLQEKLMQPANVVDANLALRAAELGAKSLGFGKQQEVPQQVAPGHIDRLADRLIALQRNLTGLRPAETLDAEFTVASR